MQAVTDPAILSQLNAAPALKPVTDPAVLAQLNGSGSGAQPGGWADPAGSLSAFVRNAANAAAFNLADPAAAAVGAAIPVKGWTSTKPTYGERYNELLGISRGETQQGQQSHPIVSFGGSLAGGMLNPATRALPAANTIGAAAGQGAGIGAAYGLGGGISNQDSLGGLAKDTLEGGTIGAATGAAFHGAGKLLLPAAKTPAAAALEAEGVNPTLGQSLGGSAQRLEDSYTSIPIFGDAIKDQQRKGITDFNRASYNRVLQPLGLSYADDAPVGNQGIQKISDLVGKAYDHAFDGATIDATSPTFTEAGSGIADEAASVLPPDRLKLFKANVDSRINGKLDQDGVLAGDDLIRAKNWFSEQSRAGPNATQDEKALVGSYKNVLGLLKQGISESDPHRAAMLQAADTAYSRFARVAHAASSNNASGKEGLFTPNQLGTSIRTLETSTRKMGFAKGQSPLQDLAQAGQQTLSQTVPDSGTAMRSIFEHPLSAIATAPAWAAGRLLYTNSGQKVAKAILFGAPGARKAIAGAPKALLPGALGLIGSGAPQTSP